MVARTHAGVLEFSAEEGTEGVPPQAALSLTKERGLASLARLKLRVKFVRLRAPPKSFVRLQPRGEGFHKAGAEVVSLDLKSVLERELQGHTVGRSETQHPFHPLSKVLIRICAL